MMHEDANELTEKMIDASRTAIENNDIRYGELKLNTLEVSVCTGAFRNALTFNSGKIKRSQWAIN